MWKTVCVISVHVWQGVNALLTVLGFLLTWHVHNHDSVYIYACIMIMKGRDSPLCPM